MARNRQGGTDSLRVRLLDGDMLPLSETRVLDGGRQIVQAVSLDPDGPRVAYHVYRQRPDLATTAMLSTDLVRIEAERMCHPFLPLAPGQLRGISWLAPVLLRLHEADSQDKPRKLTEHPDLRHTPSPSRSPGSRGNLTPTTGRYEDELRKVGGRWLLHVRRGIIEMPG
jgi:Phage portal protein, lambda family